ncbi:proline-rich protein 5 isoform X2 [Acinonyx jubatus]|nr:proline-rich protein 5 isoform X2 [Acinonyx jubatus]XP_053055469.1 proline-rich protein 5 isoform X2 [Acinonyx jubatus]
MSSPSLSDLGKREPAAAAAADERGTQQRRACANATWNSIHNGVIAVFQRKGLPDQELFSLNEGVRQLLKTELGSFFTEYLQNQLLTKGMVILRDKIRFYEGPAPSSSPRNVSEHVPCTRHRARASSVPDCPECFPATDPLGLPTTLRESRHRCRRCTKRETEAPRPASWAHAAASVPTLILERRGASPFRRAGRRGQWPGGCWLNSEPLVPRSSCTPCFYRAEASGQEPEKGHQNQSRGGGDRDRQRFRLASWRRQQRKPAGQGSGGLAPGRDALPRPSPYSAHSSALCLPPAPDQGSWDPQRREALCGLVESCLERPCPPGHPAGECRPQPASPGLGGRHGAPVRGPQGLASSSHPAQLGTQTRTGRWQFSVRTVRVKGSCGEGRVRSILAIREGCTEVVALESGLKTWSVREDVWPLQYVPWGQQLMPHPEGQPLEPTPPAPCPHVGPRGALP